jgi:glucose 1-dehydrogenase
MELEGKVALVTGGASGIGQAVAQAMADAGAAVCINWFGEHGVQAGQHAARLPRAFAIEADIGEPAQVSKLVSATIERFGGLDVLVNNAAVNRSAPLLDLPVEDWDAVVRVNLRGAFCCLQSAARAMRGSGRGGSIINMSSIHEDVAFPTFVPYAVAKGGLRMLMRTAALELAEYGIRVNNIAPGAILTPLNSATVEDAGRLALLKRIVPQGRMGTPEEVAALAVFLASDRAAYITGSTYTVDGGMSRHAERI